MKISKKELAERLGTVPLFERCTKRDLRAVARHVDVIDYDDGEEIVTEGAIADAFFLILSGEATVLRGTQAVATLGEGDYFGEIALLDPSPRTASVTATSDLRVAAMNARMFRVLLRDVPEISSAMLASLASMLRDARGWQGPPERGDDRD